MKALFTVLFMTLILTSCGSKGKSEAKLNISSVSAAGITMPGGLMLYGYNYDTSKHQSFKFVEGQDSFELDNGRWDFFVLGWTGPENLEGTTHCGFTNQLLEGGDVVVNMIVSPARCNNPGPVGNRFLETSDFSQLFLETCSALPGGDPVFADSCAGSLGNIVSIQVALRGLNNDQVLSRCIDFTPGTPLGIKIPFGRSNFQGFRTQLRVFAQAACSGPQKEILLPNGIGNEDSALLGTGGFAFASATNGTDTKIFIKDTFPKSFVSTWTVAATDVITLPIVTGFNYDFFVDWGDGSPLSHVTSATDPDRMHTYAVAGPITMKINGILPAWNFGSIPVSKDLITGVSSLGDLGWVNLQGAFQNCTNLASFSAGNETQNVTNMDSMFFQASSLSSINLGQLNTSNVTTMRRMFYFAGGSFVDTEFWDVSKVTTFFQMFRNTTLNPNVATWDISSATNLQEIFAFNTVANPDVSSWDTSNVTNFSGIFSGNTNATPDVSGWDTTSATNFSLAFSGATAAAGVLDMSGWDFTNVSDVTDMFQGVTLPTPTYSALLISLNTMTSITFANFNAGGSQYDATATAARTNLTITRNWTITDGGPQ